MEPEVYCFEEYRGFTLVVEGKFEGKWEGIAYKWDHRNPPICVYGLHPEHVRLELMEWVNKYWSED